MERFKRNLNVIEPTVYLNDSTCQLIHHSLSIHIKEAWSDSYEARHNFSRLQLIKGKKKKKEKELMRIRNQDIIGGPETGESSVAFMNNVILKKDLDDEQVDGFRSRMSFSGPRRDPRHDHEDEGTKADDLNADVDVFRFEADISNERPAVCKNLFGEKRSNASATISIPTRSLANPQQVLYQPSSVAYNYTHCYDKYPDTPMRWSPDRPICNVYPHLHGQHTMGIPYNSPMHSSELTPGFSPITPDPNVRPQLLHHYHYPPYNCTPVSHYDGTPGSQYNGSTPTKGSSNDSDDQILQTLLSIQQRAAVNNDSKYTWIGPFSEKNHNKKTHYSDKVFLGSVPWDIRDGELKFELREFGNVKLQHPGKEVRLASSTTKEKAGYLYVIFEGEKQVKKFLKNCSTIYLKDSPFPKKLFKITSSRFKNRGILEVIPWNTYDSNYVSTRNDYQPHLVKANERTVFVGALHEMMTAEFLAIVFTDLFGSVMYVGLDTDKHKYPIGSGRVTFQNGKSYKKAVSAAFIDIKCGQFFKKVCLSFNLKIILII